MFSLRSITNRDKYSAAVFIFPGMCAMLKLNCNTNTQAFHKGGERIFVSKYLVADLLSLVIISGFVVPQVVSPNSLMAK